MTAVERWDLNPHAQALDFESSVNNPARPRPLDCKYCRKSGQWMSGCATLDPGSAEQFGFDVVVTAIEVLEATNLGVALGLEAGQNHGGEALRSLLSPAHHKVREPLRRWRCCLPGGSRSCPLQLCNVLYAVLVDLLADHAGSLGCGHQGHEGAWRSVGNPGKLVVTSARRSPGVMMPSLSMLRSAAIAQFHKTELVLRHDRFNSGLTR